MKKFLSFKWTTALGCMLTAMMMLTAHTVQAAEYGIRIAGVQVTDENKGDLSVIEGVTGTATYDSEANVLSLTDATIDFEIDNCAQSINGGNKCS